MYKAMGEKIEKVDVRPSGVALIPFLLFVVIYLGAGIILDRMGVEMAFYQFPATTAVLLAVICAFVLFRGSMNEKFSTFARGVGDENMVTMCMIFLLSGAFTRVAGSMGAVSSVVNLGLSLVPGYLMAAGIFIVACFMSMATGTSMGTIAAVAPIAIGVAEAAGLPMPLMMATVVGGAMFGDNLSIISDTTIAATKLQGCSLRDKFRLNFWLAIPAAAITITLLLIFARPDAAAAASVGDWNLLLILPYLFVLIFSLIGINVFIVLVFGIFFAGIVGIFVGEMTALTVAQEIHQGFLSMMPVFLTSIFIGGLASLTTKAGGLQWLVNRVRHMIRGPKSAEIGISAMISLADMAIANNTVAIIVTGPVAREIAEEFQVDPRRSAALLDVWSCVFQGAIPYGAQLLMVVGLAGGTVSAFEIMPFLWYQWLLAAFALLSIWIPFANGTMRKNPWNFKHWKSEEELAGKKEL